MAMQLTLEDENEILIPLDECTREAWMIQYERAANAGAIEGFQERLANCFALSLSECLDSDLKPPTEAQLRYATSIARELGVPLPSEALRFRGAMTEFIARFAVSLQEKRKNLKRS